MSKIIKDPRTGCALQGAIDTISTIDGIVPIVHSISNCAIANHLANRASGSGSGFVSGYAIPGTNSLERHIIFGGASRLREEIKNTIKVVDGKLYFVLNSCESAMVGDDVDAMTKETVERGDKVISTLSAGFHGNNFYGYESATDNLFAGIDKLFGDKVVTDKHLVNILGIVPHKMPFYLGELEEITRILESLGLKVNTFFGNENGVNEVIAAKNASLTIVFSRWGIKAAQRLEALYGIPVLLQSGIPVGLKQVEKFVRTVGKKLDVSQEIIESVVNQEAKYFNKHLKFLSEEIYLRHTGRRVAFVGTESEIFPKVKFLQDYAGIDVALIVVTDGKNVETQASWSENLWSDLSARIIETADAYEVSEALVEEKVEVVFGSSIEESWAEKNDGISLPVSFPNYSEIISNQSYAGTYGAIGLLTEYLTVLKKKNKEKERKLIALIQATGS